MSAGRNVIIGLVAFSFNALFLPSAMAASNRIHGVTVSTQGQATVVEITGERAPNFTTFKQDSPRRVIVDVAESDLGGVPGSIRGDGNIVSNVTTAQYGSPPHGISRFIIGLKREAEYRVTTQGGSLYVHITPGAGGLLVSAGVPVAPKRQSSPGAVAGHAKDDLDLPLDVAPSAEADAENAPESKKAQAEPVTNPETKAGTDESEPTPALVAMADTSPTRDTQPPADSGTAVPAESSAGQVLAQSDETDDADSADDGEDVDEVDEADSEADDLEEVDESGSEDDSMDDSVDDAVPVSDEVDDSGDTEEEVPPPPPPPPAAEEEEEVPPPPPPAAEEEEEVPPPPPPAAEEEDEVPPPAAAVEDTTEEEVPQIPATDSGNYSEVEDKVEISGAMKDMTWVGFQQTMEASRVFIKTNAPVKYHVTEEGDNLVVLELENTRIPLRNNTRFLDTHFFDSAVTMITPKEIEGVSQNVRIEIQLRSKVPFTAGQDENMVYLDFRRQ